MFFPVTKRMGRSFFHATNLSVSLNKKHGASDKMCAGRDAK